MAALIDEYKQAIQDVLDGRAKEAPRPSELPWTEDKLASMWAAAAAELIAEASGSSGGGVLVVRIARNGDYLVCDKTASEIWTATQSGIVLLMFGDSTIGTIYPLKSAENAAVGYFFRFGDDYTATATNGTDYPKIPF